MEIEKSTSLQPWQQQDRESISDFRLFLAFRSLPPHQRSLSKLNALIFGGSRNSPPYEWSQKRKDGDWDNRCFEWDTFLFRLASLENYGRLLHLLESQYEKASGLLEKVDGWMAEEVETGETRKKFKAMSLSAQVALRGKLESVLQESSMRTGRIAAEVREARQDHALQEALSKEEVALLDTARTTVLEMVGKDFGMAMDVIKTLGSRPELENEDLAEIKLCLEEQFENAKSKTKDMPEPPPPSTRNQLLFSSEEEE